MITIILENNNNEELYRISEKFNTAYLIQKDPKFKCLSKLNQNDYDVFSSNDCLNLIQDLLMIKEQLTNPIQIEHINNIIKLAGLCSKAKNFTLTFTPWPEE